MAEIERYDYAFDPEGDAWAARLLRRVPEGAAVLELGPGPGAMTRVLRARGHAVTVVENDAAALQDLRGLGVHCVQADLDASDWLAALQGQRFGAILACDVLEHLRQPERVLQALRGLLQPGGSLVISLPNIAYAGVVAALRNGVFDYAEKGLLDRTHLRFYTRRSIAQLLMDCGWAPLAWDANRVPLAHSEFAWHWDALPEAWRQQLLTSWPEFDVYQWMVVATPVAEVRGWEAPQLRVEAEQLRAALQALRLTHDAEHASLLEHQKAFAEARQTIAQFQQELAALRAQAQHLAEDKVRWEQAQSAAAQEQERARAQLAQMQAALQKRSLFARLRRLWGAG